ncbi:hypothetical protein FM036_29680 [Nostoc sp. HG1]|nr:hypothetical protein [Nostoc sp. HG1]MCL6750020.1 hypothetical protein [Nostoc sp. CCCryo 231-06]
MADKYRDFQEIKYPRKLTTEAQRTRRDEEERGLLYEVFGDFLNVHDLSVDLLPKLASDEELFCTEQDNW